MPYDTTKTQWVNQDDWQYFTWYHIVSRVNWWDFYHCILQLNLELLILVYDGLLIAGFICLVCSCTRVCSMISYTVILCDVNRTPWQLYAMFYSLYPTDLMIIANIRSFSTVRFRYIAVIFLLITHDRNPIARLSGRGMGCRSWVQILIECLLLRLLCCAHHRVIYDRDI